MELNVANPPVEAIALCKRLLQLVQASVRVRENVLLLERALGRKHEPELVNES